MWTLGNQKQNALTLFNPNGTTRLFRVNLLFAIDFALPD